MTTQGFAAAVQPIAEQTVIHTDSAGLTASDILIPAGDREIPGYWAAPSGGSKLPVVLVVQEIFGVHEYIKDVCRRLAKLGYCAVAPDLYVRQGDVSKIQDHKEIFAQVVMKVPDAQVMSDLDAAAAFAEKNGNGDLDRLGITGFCWGGRATWLYAAHNRRLKAAVAWYGRLMGPTDPLHPRNPVDVVADLQCPVLGLYGGLDASIPLDTVEKLRLAVKQAGKNVEVIVYPEAGHAFHADYRPSYNQSAAEDGWQRTLQSFQQYGVK